MLERLEEPEEVMLPQEEELEKVAASPGAFAEFNLCKNHPAHDLKELPVCAQASHAAMTGAHV